MREKQPSCGTYSRIHTGRFVHQIIEIRDQALPTYGHHSMNRELLGDARLVLFRYRIFHCARQNCIVQQSIVNNWLNSIVRSLHSLLSSIPVKLTRIVV